ncbi:MAG TPA: hypothetical protein VMD28_05580 [Acidimicrobiales bacterium]|nr:hypothetical protein [Acidimicrobiales bacterium]
MDLGTVDLATVDLAVAGGGAFVAVFAVFVAAFVVLAIVTLRWAVRRDRVGRAEWVRRREAAEERGAGAAPAETDGGGAPPEGRAGPKGRAHTRRRGSAPGPPSATPTGDRRPRPEKGVVPGGGRDGGANG